MPATEETYRSQPTLHLVFAISSIVMTLSIVWMIMADHLRPWKQVQREFQVIEQDKLAAEQKKQSDKINAQELARIDQQIQAANERKEENARQIREQERNLKKLEGR